MKISNLFLILALLVIGACKNRKKIEGEKFFPVLSFIKSQVAQVDSSLNSIRRYVYVDSTRTDTFYIPREDFRAVAADFLSLPDLADPEFSDRYTEEKMFDETLNSVLLTYTPVKPEKEIIQRQEVLIKPGATEDRITNIIISLSSGNRDSAVQKRMLWKVDESFQITTTRQKLGQPETTLTEKVIWGEDE